MDETSSFRGSNRFPGQRLQLGFAVLFGLVCGISCLSVDIGHRTIESPGPTGTTKQEGSLDILGSASGVVEVYYPRPYLTPPNLQLISDQIWQAQEYMELLDQKPDRFTYRRKQGSSPPSFAKFRWKAEGVAASIPGLEPTAVKTEPLPPPAPIQPAAVKTASATEPPPPPAPIQPAAVKTASATEPPPPPTPIQPANVVPGGN